MLMKALANMGHKCLIFTSDSSEYSDVPNLEKRYEEQVIDGMSLWWVRTTKYTGAQSLWRIVSWVHFEWRLFCMPKKDLPVPNAIIISSLSILTIINGFLMRRRFRCKLIFEIRDIWPLTLIEEGGFSRFNPFILFVGWIERLGYKYADIVVGTMPNLEAHVSKVLGFRKQVPCVPMGLDTEQIHDNLPLPSGFKEKYSLDKNFVVAYAGGIGVSNALETFFLCAESLADKSDIQFVLVGEGYLKAGYQERFKHLTNLTFVPKVPRKMVQSVLRECDLLYFATPASRVWKYGQSLNKVIDYMLSGRPIIGSYSGYPSMINEANCGSYVGTADVSALRKEILRYSKLPQSELDAIGTAGRNWLLENRDYNSLALVYREIIFPKS